MKTLSTILIISLSLITNSHAAPQIIAMAPVAERGERKITIEEVTNNIQKFNYSDPRFEGSRFEENADDNDDDELDRTITDFDDLDSDAKRDIHCLTEAIYFESANEPKKGQIAVANVIMNRASWNDKQKAPRERHRIEFSGNICDVIAFNISKTYKKKLGKGKRAKWAHRTYTTCAFSYRCERGFPLKLKRAQKKDSWNAIKVLATDSYMSYNSDNNIDPSDGATFYHATWMKRYPWWAKAYERTNKIGLHQFYKIKK